MTYWKEFHNMEVTFYILYGLVQLVKMCCSICEDCLVTRVASFENQLISEYQLWSRKAPSLGVCFRLCQSDDLCVSFHYNTGSMLCRGFSAAFTSPTATATTTEADNNLFMTCKANNHYGGSCSHSSECHNTLNDCIDGICQCQAGYKYSTKTWSCYQYYFGCYQDKSTRMLPHSPMQSQSLTNEMCVSHCRDEGYSLAGSQYHYQCFCGDVIKSGYAKYAEDSCNKACRGDSTQKCGGSWAMSIYSTQQ